jgi:outer membrane protein assembly factor BamB
VWSADRGFLLGRYGLDGSFEAAVTKGTAAVGVAGDGGALYLRRLKDGVMKMGLDGKTLWENKDVMLGRLPLAPVERGGRVYCASNTGLLQVLDARDGKLLWQYQVTPQLFMFSNVAVHDGVVFAAGMDGVVSAIAPPGGER